MSPRIAPPPDTDRAAASRAAVAARRARAAVKTAIESGDRSALEVAETAWRDPASPEATLRITDLLTSIPGIGRVRAQRFLDELGISERKRVGGLGARQRPRLRGFLRTRQPRPGNALHVLSGPTAVGKSTLSEFIRESYPQVYFSVSATTRKPRPGEVDGVHYHFVSDAEFDRLIAAGELLEWAKVHNAYRYGTPRGPVFEAIAAGRRVLLEIDIAGAWQVREQVPEALLVFLAPPTWEDLVQRLSGRGTETPDEQQRRLATARTELAAQGAFDRVVINRDVVTAAREVVELMGVPRGARDF
ncbi:MAG TPA: guanylate kinase [Microbacteriaceae bacterium]|nr:guanylate kinase [Microbacteriaceae bacterium]